MDCHDQEVVEFLRFGWPANRLPSAPPPTVNRVNHRSAIDHPVFVSQYLDMECQLGAAIGPFRKIPFSGVGTGVSPLSTRPKRDSKDRRTILDLSYPQGAAVNDWIPKDKYLGMKIELKFPTVDDLARRIHELGVHCRMWKRDMSRAFRQVPLDPGSYQLFGYIWEGLLYWDTVLVMGHCIAPHICQRITNAIAHIHRTLGYFLLNYVDDFLEADLLKVVEESYQAFGRLLRSLGVEESLQKAVKPSHIIEFLGVGFNSITSTMFVTEDRL